MYKVFLCIDMKTCNKKCLKKGKDCRGSFLVSNKVLIKVGITKKILRKEYYILRIGRKKRGRMERE